MANSKSIQGEFPDLDSLIDRELIFKWLYWGLFWLMFTPSIGVTISGLFNYPDYLGTSEYLTFGRLRPMHVNVAVFGWVSMVWAGSMLYLTPRLCAARLFSERLAWATLVMQFNKGLLLERLLGFDRGHAELLAAIDGWLTSLEEGKP